MLVASRRLLVTGMRQPVTENNDEADCLYNEAAQRL